MAPDEKWQASIQRPSTAEPLISKTAMLHVRCQLSYLLEEKQKSSLIFDSVDFVSFDIFISYLHFIFNVKQTRPSSRMSERSFIASKNEYFQPARRSDLDLGREQPLDETHAVLTDVQEQKIFPPRIEIHMREDPNEGKRENIDEFDSLEESPPPYNQHEEESSTSLNSLRVVPFQLPKITWNATPLSTSSSTVQKQSKTLDGIFSTSSHSSSSREKQRPLISHLPVLEKNEST